MILGELFSEALRAIRAHRLRSFLTLLGIIIGVATLVGVVSVIAGLNQFVEEKIIRLAPDVYVVQKFGIITSREEFLDALKRRDLDWNDYQIVSRTLRQAEAVAAEITTSSAVKHLARRLGDVQVQGTTANFGPMAGLDIVAGRYFSPMEDDSAQRVAVIGADVKDELFAQQDPIGRELQLAGVSYRVIGLLARQGRTLGEERDRKLFVPFQAHRRQFGSRESINLLIKARGGLPGLPASIDEVRAVMRALRHTSFKAPDPFGIVIMNIMLVSVVERTQEIGVRRALGARPRDIRRQFLLEAALLSLFGGVVGVLLGAAAAFGVRGVLDFTATVTPGIVVMGSLRSSGVGLLAGYWPARSASYLPVVDALRAD